MPEAKYSTLTLDNYDHVINLVHQNISAEKPVTKIGGHMHRFLLSFMAIVVIALLLWGCNSGHKISLDNLEVDLNNGQLVYEDDCILCHEGAIEGAHRLDQSERWRESAQKGFDQLVANTVQGYQGKYGELPVMGMCPQCSDKDIEDAVAYMLVSAGMTK